MKERLLHKFLLVVVVVLIGILGTDTIVDTNTKPLFRIIGIEAEYGQMIVEVQHFNPDGSHWFFEHYTFQGREGLKFTPVLKSEVVVYDSFTRKFRGDDLYLDREGILSIVESIHLKRLETGWSYGKTRLVTTPLNFRDIDIRGLDLLVSRFKFLEDQIFTRDRDGNLVLFYGPRPFIDMIVGIESGTISVFYPNAQVESVTVDGSSWQNPDGSTYVVADTAEDAIHGENDHVFNTTASTRCCRIAGSSRESWWRYNNVTIPNASTIDSAKFLFRGVGVSQGSESILQGSDENDAVVIADDTGWHNRVLTTAAVQWDPASGCCSTIDKIFESPDVSIVVKEIVDRGGWTSGNDMAFFWNDDADPATSLQTIFTSSDSGFGSAGSVKLQVAWTPSSPGTTWSTIRDGIGNNFDDWNETAIIQVLAATTTNQWQYVGRAILLFDTAALADTDAITAATLGITVTVKIDNFLDSISLVTSAPASNTDLDNGDFNSLGITKQATDITIASITADSSTITDFTLNSTGRDTISLTGITKFGIRILADLSDAEPTWVSGNASLVTIATAEETLSGDKRPVLTVTHSPAPPAITGTIGDGATEDEIRDTTGTIILTIQDPADDWVAAGGTFDAQRQNIINGLDAAEIETTGWNNEVRDQISVGSVIRTSADIVTISVTGSEATGYNITASEVITVTVPSTALTLGVGKTATPTFTITAVTESLAISGTLGASGGIPAEIVAGGETIILTLTNAEWITTGSFDAQRQGIIDGMDSDKSETNGWDNRRSDFTVGDVVRTSNTIVTITLSASATYVITSDEIITVTAPAAALDLPSSLVGTPTFDIVATGNSGTWVSAALDLSSITDVAFCSLGWDETLLTGSSVVGEFSINGGTTYVTVTNGECPSVISLDGSLLTITDARIRLTLSTTIVANSPSISSLGFVLQDESGLSLDYQLFAAPTTGLTDNSSNTNNSSDMSFPDSGTNLVTTVSGVNRLGANLEVTVGVSGSTPKQEAFSIPASEEVSTNILGGDDGVLGLVSTAATSLGWSTNTLLSVFILFTSIVVGIGALKATSSLPIVVVAVGLAMAIGVFMGVLGPWVIITYVIIGGSIVGIAKST